MRMQRFSAMSTHDAAALSPLSSPSRPSAFDALSPNQNTRHNPGALSFSPRQGSSPQKKERRERWRGQPKRKHREKTHHRSLHYPSASYYSETFTTTTHMSLNEEEYSKETDNACNSEGMSLTHRCAFWCALLLVQSLLTLTLGFSTLGLSQFYPTPFFSFSFLSSEVLVDSSSKQLVPLSPHLSSSSPSSSSASPPPSCLAQEICVAHYINTTFSNTSDSSEILYNFDKKNRSGISVPVVVCAFNKSKSTTSHPSIPLSLFLSPRQSLFVQIYSQSKGLCLQWQARFLKGVAVWEDCEDFGR